MSDEPALLTAIAANPDEDTPRLMYADWLDEHAQAVRAEFIRVQIAISQKEHLPRAALNRHVDLFKRNQELIDRHRAELLGPLAMLPRAARIEFRRGFLARIELHVEPFLGHAGLLAGLQPQPGVRVTAVAASLAEFTRCPHLDVVTELAAYSPTPELAVPDEIDILDAAERLTRLAVLDVEGCALGDWFCELLDNFALPALVELDLSQNAITDIGVQSFLRTHHPQKLKRLVLGGNPIGDDGAIDLARWPTGDADRLENLNMRFTNIGPVGQQALLNRFGGRIDLF